MKTLHALILFPLSAGCAGLRETGVASDLSAIRSVGREGSGNAEASDAARRLSSLEASRLTEVLAAFDGATPEARNWLRGVVEAIADRTVTEGRELPAKALEAFVLDRSRDGKARRLAYDWLLRADPRACDRILPGALDDPSVEIRRDAVDREIRAAEELLAGEQADEARAAFARLLPFARDRDQVERIAKKLEPLGETPNLTRHFGFIRTWRLAGPFDNTAKKGYAAVYPPEERIDFEAEHDGKTGKVRWVEHETQDAYGKVDLNKAIGKHMGAVAYAAAEFDSPHYRVAEIRAGSSNAVKIWLNGELVFTRDEYHHGMDPDQYRAAVELRSGRNTILIKVCQNEGKEEWEQDWIFQLRVCDPTGGGIS